MTTETALPTYADVEDAARRIEGVAHRTPVLTSRYVNELYGVELFFKAEHLQRMGAFKFRGALNALSRFTVWSRSPPATTLRRSRWPRASSASRP